MFASVFTPTGSRWTIRFGGWNRADFRILCNEVRIQKHRLEENDSSFPIARIEAIIKEKEAEVVKERAAIISDLQHLTATFVEGATREYVSLRKFFMLFLYRTIRFAFENLSDEDFEKLLTENPDGVSFDVPGRGTVSFAPHLCRKIAMANKKLTVTTIGVDTSTIAIAFAILQAPHHKHCVSPTCRREDCICVKSEYEELFEAFFKEKARSLGHQKCRGELSATYEVMLTFPTKEPEKEPEPEPEPVKQQPIFRIG
ncbi:hypothetical protein KP509_34G073700 [Ceratopteris richardii]|uniref:Uncharacterized protein n=1 Tax=Ceratopteris richardii TaxID=49495 RepID=A0A8T2QNG4_CERRI|nr:hypothetical protein KP509_34G073700 [Ceratopteris richardii]